MNRLLIISTLLFFYFCLLPAQNILTLDRSKELALQNNAKLKSSALELEGSREVKKSAFTKYFPSVSAGAFAMKADKSLIEMNIPGGNLPVYDGNPVNLLAPAQFAYFPGLEFSLLNELKAGFLTAVQPLFAGGRIINGNRLSSLGVEVNEIKYKLAKSEVLMATEEKFWQIALLNEKSLTLESYHKLLEQLLLQITDAYKAGLVTRNDLLKVQLKKSEIELNRSKLNNGKELAMMAFCQFIGIEFDQSIELKYDFGIIEDPSIYKTDHLESLRRREEYSLLQKSLNAAELLSSMKLGEFLPQIGVGLSGYSMKMDKNKYESNFLAFATISIPISNWWSGAHELKESKIKEELAENSFKENSDLMLLQMKKVWQDLSESYTQVNLCKESVLQAEENLKVNNDSYNRGISNLSDLLEAQAMLQQANDNLADAKTNYIINLKNYLKVTGRYDNK